jgi:hypothetical protein
MDRAPSLLVRCAPLCALLVAPASVSANFRPGAFGEPAGEPLESDWFRNIHVLHEDLHFDLRPLEDDGFPVVEVRYRIRNDGPALDAPLEFISPGIRRSSVLVDGCVVPADAMGDPRHLDEWHMEVDVPTIGGGTHPYSYILGGTRRGDPDGESIRFVASMEHGEHDLLVRYDVRPMSHAGWRMAEQFDVAYLLAPARAWASFGELDVTVLLPEEWEFASTLPLARKGDEARGTFDGLPADALAVAAVRPTPMWVEVLAWVPHVLAALFFRWWMRRARTAGRLEGRLRVPSALGWGAWVVGAVSAAFLVVGFCLSAFLMSLGRSLWFALHAYGWWAIVPVGLVAVPIAGLCGWVTGRGEALPPARYGSLSSE